jgi:hypothetical protein
MSMAFRHWLASAYLVLRSAMRISTIMTTCVSGPVMAVLAGKLSANQSDCAPVAGKSTLNRLEGSREEPGRYHKISHDGRAIEALFADLFLEAHAQPPQQIIFGSRRHHAADGRRPEQTDRPHQKAAPFLNGVLSRFATGRALRTVVTVKGDRETKKRHSPSPRRCSLACCQALFNCILVGDKPFARTLAGVEQGSESRLTCEGSKDLLQVIDTEGVPAFALL